jgi:transposase InsO family protein
MKVIKKMLKVSYRDVCRSLDFGYSTFMRWKGRVRKGTPIVEKPGPKKTMPLELTGLMDGIRSLDHKRKRSYGTGLLFEVYQDQVSRGTYKRLVRLARADANREKAARMRRIEWKQPGLVWGMDDTYFGRDENYRKLFLHSVRDLSSRYQFEPLGGDFARGPKVAENLKRLFDRYGPPLILKRDNGSNLEHHDVEKVLSEYRVIPLNSPRRYPPYNGAVEKGQFELKQKIGKRKANYWALPRRHFHVYAESASYELNHVPRRCIRMKTSCQVFFSEKGGVKFPKRRRREIFEWIKDLSCAIMVGLGNSSKRAAQAAWRLAVESWLQLNGFIQVSRDGKVLPYFLPEMSH